MHAQYDHLIDGIDYRTIEAYLHNPATPIQYIVHARERAMLSPLAAYLDDAITQGKAAPEHIRGLLLPRIDRGEVLVTATRPLLMPVGSLVESAAIPKDTYCQVIYLPPFYLSHTQGLFEAMQKKAELKTEKSISELPAFHCKVR